MLLCALICDQKVDNVQPRVSMYVAPYIFSLCRLELPS